MGLVNTVVPLARLEEETVAWCREILANSPLAIRCLKAALNADCDGQAGLQELAGNATLLFYMSEEGQEGRNAYLEKRKTGLLALPQTPVAGGREWALTDRAGRDPRLGPAPGSAAVRRRPTLERAAGLLVIVSTTAKGTPGSARRRPCRGCTPRASRRPPRSCSRTRRAAGRRGHPRGVPRPRRRLRDLARADCGLHPSVRTGVEGAVLTLLADRAGKDLPHLLAADPAARVRINGLLDGDPRRSSRAPRVSRGCGYTALKIKVGRRDARRRGASSWPRCGRSSGRRLRCASTPTAPGTCRRPSISRRASRPPASNISRSRCATQETWRPSSRARRFPSPSTRRCSAFPRRRRRRCRASPR